MTVSAINPKRAFSVTVSAINPKRAFSVTVSALFLLALLAFDWHVGRVVGQGGWGLCGPGDN